MTYSPTQGSEYLVDTFAADPFAIAICYDGKIIIRGFVSTSRGLELHWEEVK